MKKAVWIILIIALAVILFAVLRRPNQNPGDMIETGDEQTAEEARETKDEQTPQPAGEEDVPQAREIKDNQLAETAFLTAVDGSGSEGVAYKLLADRFFIHFVEAQMPEPAEGNVYEGWLVQPEPLEFFSTGVMEQNAEGMWTLEFVSDESEYSTYTQVIITEETELDAQPEKHVLQGSF